MTSTPTTSTKLTPWERFADSALAGDVLSSDDAIAVLRAPDDELDALLQAAFRVRSHYFGRKVKLNMLVNAKCGHCPEDCGYCSQSKDSSAPIQKYTFLDADTLMAGARAAIERQAGTYCIVAAGRGPTRQELDRFCDAVREIKAQLPLKICACLGLLKEGQAEQLKAAGVDRYNHNINTSSARYDTICTTHTYQDRIETLNRAHMAGISLCSGVIIGMGERDEEIIDMALALRELEADSIPVNFLVAIDGTPLEGRHELNAERCLKVLCLFRFLCPDREIRASAGREVHLGERQAQCLYPANSIFIGDYLTTSGDDPETDFRMIEELGFEIETCAL